MKNTCLFLFLITMHSLLTAHNNQEIFLQANQAYEQNNSKEAFKLYSSITQKGLAVWYNMGNCCYKLENPVDALVHWRRAQLQHQPELVYAAEHNIQMLAHKVGITTSKSLITRLNDGLKKISMYGSLLVWQLGFLIVWMLLFSLIGFKRRFIFFSINGLCVVMLATLLGLKYSDTHKQYGIMNTETSVYIGPGEHFSVQSKLQKMQEVIVTKKVDTWHNVSHAGGRGWIPANKISLIN